RAGLRRRVRPARLPGAGGPGRDRGGGHRAAHDDVGGLVEPDALLLQPHPHPAARRLPPALPPAPARPGRPLPLAPAVRVPAAPGGAAPGQAGDRRAAHPRLGEHGVPRAPGPPLRRGRRLEHLSVMTVAAAPTAALGASPGFVVRLEGFSGPLDLLLHLLREERIDIADIPIARICDQFLQAIHELGLNRAADYLDMASRL